MTIRLPKFDLEASKEKTLSSGRKTGRPLIDSMKILIVDDYLNMRRTIQGILRQMGFKDFRHAEDGLIAVRMLEMEKVGLIIADWNMPNMTGIELLRFIRASDELKDIPFLMVTGEATRESIIEAAESKVSGYLVKPFPADTLIKKIEDIFS